MKIPGHVGSLYHNGRWRNAPRYYKQKVFTPIEEGLFNEKEMHHHAYELFKHDSMIDFFPSNVNADRYASIFCRHQDPIRDIAQTKYDNPLVVLLT
ncbi:hypothetical protein AGMMS49921_08750 [Endomicrobiia bacterium]|nr:hypothetical protein AGMMS49921_08750 [Endomicrobiia bacterium]